MSIRPKNLIHHYIQLHMIAVYKTQVTTDSTRPIRRFRSPSLSTKTSEQLKAYSKSIRRYQEAHHYVDVDQTNIRRWHCITQHQNCDPQQNADDYGAHNYKRIYYVFNNINDIVLDTVSTLSMTSPTTLSTTSPTTSSTTSPATTSASTSMRAFVQP